MKKSKMQISRREGLTMKLQKLGGYASIILACITIICVIIVVRTFQGLTGLDIYDPVKMIAAYQTSTTAFCAFYILGILAAILTPLPVLALEERMQTDAPLLMRLAVIAAFIFSALYLTAMIGGFFRNELLATTNDMSAFRAFLVMHELLGSAAGNALGWGFLLSGWTAIRSRKLPQILGYIIILLGIGNVFGFAFTVSQFNLGIIILQLLNLIVLVWLGIVFLRKNV